LELATVVEVLREAYHQRIQEVRENVPLATTSNSWQHIDSIAI
jgi:hypothetical protein